MRWGWRNTSSISVSIPTCTPAVISSAWGRACWYCRRIIGKACRRFARSGSRTSQASDTSPQVRGDTIMLPISWILPRARAMFPDRLAIWDGEGRHRFQQLGRRVDALAGAFKANGLKQGDRVAILDVNSSRYAEAYYACAQAGTV